MFRIIWIEQMDESSQKKKGFDAIMIAINMAVMGAGIAAAVIAANKSKDARTGQKQFTIIAASKRSCLFR